MNSSKHVFDVTAVSHSLIQSSWKFQEILSTLLATTYKKISRFGDMSPSSTSDPLRNSLLITFDRNKIETWIFLRSKEDSLACPTVWNLIGWAIDQSGEFSLVSLRTMLWMYSSSHCNWWIIYSIENIFLFRTSYCWGFYLFPFMSSRVSKKTRDFPKLVKINLNKVPPGLKHIPESIGAVRFRFKDDIDEVFWVSKFYEFWPCWPVVWKYHQNEPTWISNRKRTPPIDSGMCFTPGGTLFRLILTNLGKSLVFLETRELMNGNR